MKHDEIHLIGCGGTGGFLAPILSKCTKGELYLWDKDVYEKKNLDRQLFDESHIGFSKAHCLADMYFPDGSVIVVSEYLRTSNFRAGGIPLLICAADNHTARVTCLELADRYRGFAIIAGNSTTDAEAYLYQHNWFETNLDPRVYYPDLLEDDSANDPNNCTGEILESEPQLASANALAASMVMWLYHAWFEEEEISEDLMPFKFVASKWRIYTATVGDAE